VDDVEFVSSLRASAVDGYLSSYARALTNGVAERNADSFVQLFASVTGEQKEAILRAVRQVAIDAISQVLGVIDGTSSIPGVPNGMELKLPSGERLDGDLQSEFLILFEDE
jgi:hypothetical protein